MTALMLNAAALAVIMLHVAKFTIDIDIILKLLQLCYLDLRQYLVS
jgi:hypothetical protein